MSIQPRRERGGFAVRQHIDLSVADRIDDHGGVAVAAAQRDIVNSDHSRRRHRRNRQRRQHLQHRRTRDRHAQQPQEDTVVLDLLDDH
jgi:hypothetical protein